MNRESLANANDQRLPRLWRLGLVALCTLILCSCRGPAPIQAPSPALPRDASGPAAWQPCPNDAIVTAPVEGTPVGPWAPPGISQPWPQDEYLADGGDRNIQVAVNTDWQVRGLDPEDTIAHFDTLDGQTLVEASNRVDIYSPRFGSIRKVVSLVQGEQNDRVGDVHQPTSLVRHDDITRVASSKQQIQPGRNRGAQPPIIYQAKQGDGALSTALGLSSFQDAFKPYENLKLIREGSVDSRESARLAKGIAAAIVWSSVDSLQIMLDHQAATENVNAVKPNVIYTVDQPPANPKLRVVKVASAQMAEPGDTIDFTIRFDNVGNQPIGNVTLLDNLTTRLEYIPQSAQSSLDADFRAETNEAGSLLLRWEIKNPLPAGQGGVVRFRCRVR